MKYIERGGAKIGYDIRGCGTPILLCLGLLGDESFWDEIILKLQNNFCLIIPDLRGHRYSSTHRPFSLWDLADDLVTILDAEKINACHAVGFSMGGMACLRKELAPLFLTTISEQRRMGGEICAGTL